LRHDKPNRPQTRLRFLVEEAERELRELGPLGPDGDAFREGLYLRGERTLPGRPSQLVAGQGAQPGQATPDEAVPLELLPGLPPAPPPDATDGDPPTPARGNTSPSLQGVGELRLVTRLAVGGMAEIWLADVVEGQLPDAQVVVKRLLPALRGDPGSVERLRAEAELGTTLLHENLARSYGLFQRGAELFLVQELLGGETLGVLASAARARGERLAPAAVLHAVDGLLSGLAFLHGDEGDHGHLLHCDVNPDNLVAGRDGSVKLIDLGLSQPLDAEGLVRSPDGALRGTPAYMSPEQVKSRPLATSSDLFSAGIVLWELLANRPLFATESQFETLRRVRELPAPPLRAVWPEAPTALERILVRALAKEPSQRYQSAPELRTELRNAARREGLRPTAAELASEVVRLVPAAQDLQDP
jgi:serine/threonine-protein kinase